MNDNAHINHPVLKAFSAVLAGFTGMHIGEWASLIAFIYTSCLLAEWIWKRIVKPLLRRYTKIRFSHTQHGD